MTVACRRVISGRTGRQSAATAISLGSPVAEPLAFPGAATQQLCCWGGSPQRQERWSVDRAKHNGVFLMLLKANKAFIKIPPHPP